MSDTECTLLLNVFGGVLVSLGGGFLVSLIMHALEQKNHIPLPSQLKCAWLSVKNRTELAWWIASISTALGVLFLVLGATVCPEDILAVVPLVDTTKPPAEPQVTSYICDLPLFSPLIKLAREPLKQPSGPKYQFSIHIVNLRENLDVLYEPLDDNSCWNATRVWINILGRKNRRFRQVRQYCRIDREVWQFDFEAYNGEFDGATVVLHDKLCDERYQSIGPIHLPVVQEAIPTSAPTKPVDTFSPTESPTSGLHMSFPPSLFMPTGTPTELLDTKPRPTQGPSSADNPTVPDPTQDPASGPLPTGPLTTQPLPTRPPPTMKPTPEPTPPATAQPTDICDLPLPKPEILLAGGEVFQESEYIEYTLDVMNLEKYPEAMFAEAPDLPPCGLTTHAARTWTELRDGETDELIFLFCYPEALKSLYFVALAGEIKSVYAVYIDRFCDVAFVSNTIDIPVTDFL